MAEEKKNKKTARPKKETVAPVDNNIALVEENKELKKNVDFLEKELRNNNGRIESLVKEIESFQTKILELEDERNTTSVYRFVAKYDNIQLSGVVLNNVKCVIYECEAETFEAAMNLFDAQLKSVLNIDDSKLNDVKGRIFGGKMIVEHEDVVFAEELVGKRK